VKINLGGGEGSSEGWVTLDPMYGEGEWKRFAQDVPWPVADGTVEKIYACHVLEHIPAGEPRIAVFNEAWRVLAPEGPLRDPGAALPASVLGLGPDASQFLRARLLPLLLQTGRPFRCQLARLAAGGDDHL